MINQKTIQKLNSIRDVLVGKVPDPKAQVEQISTAMMYKFMDDMDRKSLTLGGKRAFFTDEFAKYAWSKLFDPKLSAHELLDLYDEAIMNMSKNPNLPQLFRNIFKGAFLPYKDPRILRLFLKEINQFSYENNANLGCAFEHLLSIMGSQGDAGQFRTPRHIIDFIVAVIDPKKEETILDPACGTAGFLISAFKHIWKSNSKINEQASNQTGQYKGEFLTPIEKIKITENIHGYDISPEMVKMSLVNLFLHQFPNPKIHEYDTLSSDKRWEENFDVIFANPPFMTPKGGIVPHTKFSVQAKRAEVLFVSYIADHLKANGRAGIIVPEGIIFQSANAYKELRKKLIEDWGLYAVVSLPTGVFQPYSGVKTSILLIDKKLAKTTDSILFIKIENDGLTLNVNRKEISKNDLPKAIEILKQWKNSKTVPKSNIAHQVLKSEIIKSDGHVLIGDRYLQTINLNNIKWPMIELEKIVEIKKGTPITKKNITLGIIPVIAGGKKPAYFHNKSNRIKKTITISSSGMNAGFVNYFETSIFASDCSTINSNDSKKISIKFLFYLLKLKQNEIYKLQIGMAQPHVYAKDIAKIKIPLPPLKIQKQIVEEVEDYQKVIDGAKQVVENWKPSFKIDPKWPIIELSKIVEIKKGTPITKKNITLGIIPVIAGGKKPAYFHNKSNRIKKTITISSSGMNAGFVNYFETSIFASDCSTINSNDSKKISIKFLFYLLKLKQNEIYKLQIGMAQPHVYAKDIAKIKIPLPPLEIQKEIVEEIEDYQKAINTSKWLIEKMEKKISNKIEEVWKTDL